MTFLKHYFFGDKIPTSWERKFPSTEPMEALEEYQIAENIFCPTLCPPGRSKSMGISSKRNGKAGIGESKKVVCLVGKIP